MGEIFEMDLRMVRHAIHCQPLLSYLIGRNEQRFAALARGTDEPPKSELSSVVPGLGDCIPAPWLASSANISRRMRHPPSLFTRSHRSESSDISTGEAPEQG